jgi:hypothetical protein
MFKIAAMLLLSVSSCQLLAAQRFLVPIHLLEPVNGAFGSRWVSELTVLNTGSSAAYIENFGTCPPIGAPCFNPIMPNVAETGTMIRNFDFTIPAAILFVEDGYAEQLSFTARIRDISRTASSWGTWLPVVPESAATRGPVTLLDIPVSEGFRQTLRVYSFDKAERRTVRVRVYGAVPIDPANPATYTEPNPLLRELTLPLRYSPGLAAAPLYGELGNVAAALGITGHDRIWLTVEPVGDFGVWGMVSVTSNTTQEITMIVPHRAR